MKRPAGILLGVSLFIAAFAAPALAAPVDCALTVTPAQGPPGTEFVFAGAGYTPTRLTLHQSGAEARVNELDLHGADPFEIRLVAADEDAGRWRATASIPGTECAGEVTFKVTLPPTATIDPAVDDSGGLSRNAILLGLSALISVFLFAAWHFGGRFAHRP